MTIHIAPDAALTISSSSSDAHRTRYLNLSFLPSRILMMSGEAHIFAMHWGEERKRVEVVREE